MLLVWPGAEASSHQPHECTILEADLQPQSNLQMITALVKVLMTTTLETIGKNHPDKPL